MPGSVHQNGAELCLNDIAGLSVPFVGSSAPTWIPGLYWIDTTTGSAPAAPTVGNAGSGGTVAAGTYGAIITYVNAWGETVGSASASTTTTGTTSTITVNSPAANGTATGWYAYVTQAGGSTYTRQQTAGNPTAIGTNLTLTAPPTSGGANPPSYSAYAVKSWNGSAWVSSPVAGSRYLALLIADPATSGPNGGPAVQISDLAEDTTAGYGRQLFTFNDAGAGPPADLANSATITFGPYTANQAVPVQWAALVTAASGTAGLLLYTWDLDTIQQVSVSEDIVIPAGSLSLQQQ